MKKKKKKKILNDRCNVGFKVNSTSFRRDSLTEINKYVDDGMRGTTAKEECAGMRMTHEKGPNTKEEATSWRSAAAERTLFDKEK